MRAEELRQRGSDEITKHPLQNRMYDIDGASGGKARLVNGKFEDKPDAPGEATHLSIQLGEIAIAKAPADGEPAAAVVLYSDPG